MRCLWVVYFTTITQYGILQGVSSRNVWVIRTYVASNNRTSPLMNIFSNAYPWQRLCIFLLVDRIGPFPKSVNEHNMMSPFTYQHKISTHLTQEEALLKAGGGASSKSEVHSACRHRQLQCIGLHELLNIYARSKIYQEPGNGTPNITYQAGPRQGLVLSKKGLGVLA